MRSGQRFVPDSTPSRCANMQTVLEVHRFHPRLNLYHALDAGFQLPALELTPAVLRHAQQGLLSPRQTRKSKLLFLACSTLLDCPAHSVKLPFRNKAVGQDTLLEHLVSSELLKTPEHVQVCISGSAGRPPMCSQSDSLVFLRFLHRSSRSEKTERPRKKAETANTKIAKGWI